MQWADEFAGKVHSFVVCAYKESEFLEQCVKSLVRQTVKSNTLIVTSTPNDHIYGIAAKYGIEVLVREGRSDIKDDWNFAYDSAKTKWVTVAHQDDLYSKYYVEAFLRKVYGIRTKNSYQSLEGQTGDEPAVFLTDYLPIEKGIIGIKDVNCRLRRFLRSPLKFSPAANSRLCRKAILAFGNSICCPTVSYNREKLGPAVFTSEMRFNIDWDTFLKLADMKVSFSYVDLPLTFYRVHNDATSKEFIMDGGRAKEDLAMFEKFWPGPVARFIMVFYKKAYNIYA